MAFFDFLKKKPSTVLTVIDGVTRIHAELVDEKYADYCVEHYPFSGFYKAKFQDYYLYRWYSTGIVELDRLHGFNKCQKRERSLAYR